MVLARDLTCREAHEGVCCSVDAPFYDMLMLAADELMSHFITTEQGSAALTVGAIFLFTATFEGGSSLQSNAILTTYRKSGPRLLVFAQVNVSDSGVDKLALQLPLVFLSAPAVLKPFFAHAHRSGRPVVSVAIQTVSTRSVRGSFSEVKSTSVAPAFEFYPTGRQQARSRRRAGPIDVELKEMDQAFADVCKYDMKDFGEERNKERVQNPRRVRRPRQRLVKEFACV